MILLQWWQTWTQCRWKRGKTGSFTVSENKIWQFLIVKHTAQKLLGIYPKEKLVLYKNLCTNAHRSFIYNIPKLATTQMSFNEKSVNCGISIQWINNNKYYSIHSYIQKMECISRAICWMKKSKGYILYDSSYNILQWQIIAVKHRWWFPRLTAELRV